ncbi:response regulator transcription factor [Proteocatella sphenisci]|uniref:response regulator transcription factor n=1 Tax=Proteocatella sphenisci TaxID=181070 RepID=UPI000684508F|nr:response regulator transcription factor [Proteocatella sphenisci]
MKITASSEGEATILVVDDDIEIANSVAKILEKEGYMSLIAHDGIEALEIIAQKQVDLIILDIMMPRLDGLSATMKIREKRNIPIIILSAKTEDSDKVLGLSMGADDYVSKPYNSMELVARVKSQLRRYLYLGSSKRLQERTSQSGEMIRVGGLELDKNSKTIIVDGREENLTATEYKILKLLMENPGRVFPSEEIYERVWNEEAYSVENTVMVHIRRIREKIEINTKEPKYLKVVWGIGYKIENKFI